MKEVLSVIALLAVMSMPAFGTLALLSPGDAIIAIDADGGSRSPDAETVDHAIDGVLQKYLNFGDASGGDENNTGFIVTPGIGVSIVDSFAITTANDSEERDPATWALYGTNDPILSINHSTGVAEAWTLIDSGSISLPVARDTLGPTIAVSNAATYASYKMLFPTVKDAGAANSMQIAEIQFYGVPEPATICLLGMGGLALIRRRRS
jgi:hypothetical protein